MPPVPPYPSVVPFEQEVKYNFKIIFKVSIDYIAQHVFILKIRKGDPYESGKRTPPPQGHALLSFPTKAAPGQAAGKGPGPYDGLRPWSAITHGIGAALALLGTVLLLLRCAALSLSPWHVVSFLIYGVSMVGLYTASTLYHCRNVSVKGRIALRKYDHASIYFLIAGTYTPICLVVLRTDGAWGWALFGVIWALALAGLVLTLAWITAPAGSPPASISSWAGWLWWPSSPCCACSPCRLFLGAGRRHSLHRGRRALRRQVAWPR